jgi:hypothetical protein
MAIDAQGNGLTYIGDVDGVSLYQLKFQNLDVFQVGASVSDPKIKVRKSPADEWLVTPSVALLTDDNSRIAGSYIHGFVGTNLQKLLVDLYVIPQLTSQIEIPDFAPGE